MSLMAKSNGTDDAPITIKKYANRRLYNTATSSYITLEYLCQMVKDGIDFVVYDARTGADITHPVLTQVIVEEEAKGQNLLPIGFLRQLIGFYGDSRQQMLLPGYLEFSMKTFVQNQARMGKVMGGEADCADGDEDQIAALERKLNALQAEIATMTGK